MGEGALDSMFSSFNKEPVASASLAQVHHAVLRDGREVGNDIMNGRGLESEGSQYND